MAVMVSLHEKYIVDESGKTREVILPVQAWRKVLELLEELDDIRAYDKAHSKKTAPIVWDAAKQRLKKRHA